MRPEICEFAAGRLFSDEMPVVPPVREAFVTQMPRRLRSERRQANVGGLDGRYAGNPG